MAAAQTKHVTVGPFVMNVMNRHPAVVARMASTLQIASGWPARPRASASAVRRRSTLPTGSTFPRRPNGSARRGGRRRHPRPVDGWPGDTAFALLPAGGRRRVPRPRSGAADHRRRGDATRGARSPRASAMAGAHSRTISWRTCPCYLEALEAVGKRREDQTVIVGLPGRLARGEEQRQRVRLAR